MNTQILPNFHDRLRLAALIDQFTTTPGAGLPTQDVAWLLDELEQAYSALPGGDR